MMVDDINKRAARQEGRGGGRRPASTGRSSPKRRAICWQRKSRRRVRLLDIGVAQIGAAGVRGAERSCSSGAVRGRESRATCSTPGGAQPAGDPGGRVSDERRRRQRKALCSGTDCVYPRTTNKILEALEGKGVAADAIKINYTPFGYPTGRRKSRDQKFAAEGKKPRWCRPSTATPMCRLQRIIQRRHQGVRHSGGGILGRRGRAGGIDTKTWWATRRLELLRSVRNPTNEAFIKQCTIIRARSVTNDPMGALHRLQDVGAGSARPAPPMSTRCGRRCTAESQGARRLRLDDEHQPSPVGR